MPRKSRKPGKPKWLADILAHERAKGCCRVCRHATTDHLVAIRTSFEEFRQLKKLALFTREELQAELNKYSVLCIWCFRIYTAKRSRTMVAERTFDPRYPCSGRICKGPWCGHYQLCDQCFEHHAQLKSVLYDRVNAYKRSFRECPVCHTVIAQGNEMCFDLDHLDPYLKEGNVSHMIRRLRPFAEIRREMEKCRLLCCHCHKDHTKTQQAIFRHPDFQRTRTYLKQHGTLPPASAPQDDDSSDYEDEPVVRSTYNPLDDPPSQHRPPPDIVGQGM
jgi:hypothetical protein